MLLWRKNKPARNRRKDGKGFALRMPQINWRRWAPLAVVLAVVLGALLIVKRALDQPLQRVAISGRFQRVQALDVEQAVRRHVGRQGMIGVDLQAISRAVETIPWVDKANVSRSWPRGVHVQVTEQIPVARWGESGLLNIRGEVFVNDTRHMPAELPALAGPNGYQMQMTARYLSAQPRLVESGMRLAQLRLDDRGAWELALDNGVVLRLGQQHIDERFERFMQAAARLVASRAAEISYVDMRYANGFAIGWRTGANEVKRG
jgi:cell division protein FtsQ